MSTVTKYQMFLESVVTQQSLNFPLLAEAVGLDWFADVKPKLDNDAEFEREFVKALQRLKHQLMDCVLRVGLYGKQRGMPQPEIQYIKAIMTWIDNKSVIGKDTDSKKSEKEDDTIDNMLKEFGI